VSVRVAGPLVQVPGPLSHPAIGGPDAVPGPAGNPLRRVASVVVIEEAPEVIGGTVVHGSRFPSVRATPPPVVVEALDELKEDEQHSSYDSVVRSLILRNQNAKNE
jgi:hypothetical protein